MMSTEYCKEKKISIKKRMFKMVKNEMINIKDKKIFALLLPALSLGIVMILFDLLDAISGFVLTISDSVFPLDSTIQDLLALLIAQLITVSIVMSVLIPLFKVKNIEAYPISFSSSKKTLVLFFLAIGITFLSSLFFTILFTILKWDIKAGYSEIILSLEHLSNPLNIALFLVTMTIGAALFEEIAYRRLLIPLLEKIQVDPSRAVIISSIIFAMAHLEEDILYGTIAGAINHTIGIFLFAVVLGITYTKTRNVFFPIFIHGLSNLLGSLSILITLIGDEGLLTVFSIIMILLLVIGLGISIYLMVKFLYNLKTDSKFSIENESEPNGLIGLIGFLFVGLSLIYSPIIIEICITSLKIDSTLSEIVLILCLTCIFCILVRMMSKKTWFTQN